MPVSFEHLPDIRRRALLVGLALPAQPAWRVEEHLDELAELARTAGLEVAGRSMQRRRAPDAATFVGSGKAQELANAVGSVGSDLVVFDDDLTPGQVKKLEEIFGVAVMDRSGLILEIFYQRARSREARTQVELAQLNYLLPRLTRLWRHLSRQVGGIGVRGGAGETQLEADRRVLRQRIRRLERELEKIERTRAVQRRGRRNAPTVALVGYTNAGKSTLFNRLTHGEASVEDKLFATLDSKLRQGSLGDRRTAVFADTVGFIRKLPHHLVASFRSTLEELAQADLVLHVIDRSNPRWEEQIVVAEQVLRDLGVDEARVLKVFNKSDRVPVGERRNGGALWVSATSGDGIERLREEIARQLDRWEASVAELPGRPEVALR